MNLPLVVIFVVVAISALLVPQSIWLLITGRNPPGILGRGFTRGDNQRLRRAPPIYFRVLGLVVGVAAVDGFCLAWLMSALSAPSLAQLLLSATVLGLLAVPSGGAVVWLFVLAGKYRLFRWDKP